MSNKNNYGRLRLIPSLSARALQTKCDKEMALWYCLRSLNIDGSGVLDVHNGVQLVCRRFNYSPRTVSRLLSSGEHIFWRRTSTHPQILLNGVAKLVKRLGVAGDYLDRYYRLEVGEFNTLAKRRAALFASTLKPGNIKSKPIARDTIESITGVNPRQQRRYDNIAGIKSVANFEVVRIEQGKVRYQLRKRIGNIYHTKQESQPHGMLKRSIKRCRVLLESMGLQPPVKSRFTSWKGLGKAFRGGLFMGHVLLPRTLRLKPKRLEWQAVLNTSPEIRTVGV